MTIERDVLDRLDRLGIRYYVSLERYAAILGIRDRLEMVRGG